MTRRKWLILFTAGACCLLPLGVYWYGGAVKPSLAPEEQHLEWEAALSGPDPAVRQQTLAVCVGHLRSPRSKYGGAAAVALAQAAPFSDEAFTALKGAAADSNPKIRWNAVNGLGYMHPPSDEAVCILATASVDFDHEIATAATRAFSVWPGRSRKALPLLRDFLAHPEPLVRNRALAAIACFGPVAKELLPNVRVLLQDPEPRVRENAKATVAFLTPDGPLH